ncbi:M56 family metallopeptidase [Undibacterium curvum]|uniref:Serine hydrolase n=1 Tax=Undibacterium curvum TaxID=2762294 RepID=A0ABR6ZZP0_9BURK|nr:M56 family metallopeptidase [Undibacterium curvum]MBC3930128.1 serine hydrolase [Undibacterium curvum]
MSAAISQFSFERLTQILGWPLLDFVWQGVLIAGVAALLLSLCRHARPQTRYLIASGAMLLCALLPLAGMLLQASRPPSLTLSAALQLLAETSATTEVQWQDSNLLLSMLAPVLPFLVTLWLSGVTLMLSRYLLGLLWIARLGSQAGQATYLSAMGDWQHSARTLQARFGIRREVRLLWKTEILSPMTTGCWRPVILMPVSLLSGMSPSMIEALLAHELAHIRRWDYLVKLLQNLVQALLFYHPVVWWLGRQMDSERELIADQLAVAATGQSRELALALQSLDQMQMQQQALALAAHGGDLLSRIRQILRPGPQAWQWKMALPVVLAVVSLMLIFQTKVDAVPAADQLVLNQQAHEAALPAKLMINTHSRHVMVLDEASGAVLLQKNADVAVPIASISKLLTAMVTLDAQLDMQQELQLSRQDMVGSQQGLTLLKPGLSVTRQQLLELMLVPSSNTAAKALGRTYPGGEAALIAAMQRKLQALGLHQTSIEEPVGISANNRSSAADLARLARIAAAYPELQKLSGSPEMKLSLAGKTERLPSSNPLVGQASWDISLTKTGYSKAAGRCLLLRTKIAGKHWIVVLLNADQFAMRTEDAELIRDAISGAVSASSSASSSASILDGSAVMAR